MAAAEKAAVKVTGMARSRKREREGEAVRRFLRSGPIDQGTLVLAGLTRCYIVFVHLVKTIGAIEKHRAAHAHARPRSRLMHTIRVIMV